MRIVLLCATRRGLLVLQKLSQLVPAAQLSIFSFREEPSEPPFLDSIREQTLALGGSFFEARRVGADKWKFFWETTPVDLMFMVSWRYLVPPAVFQRPRLGTFVLHDALLPAYRGFSPTVWAIINGEDHGGATLFEISEAVDEGDIVEQERVPIGPAETIATVMDRVTGAYLRLLEKNLPGLLAGAAPRRPQDHSLATYTCRRTAEDNQINWNADTKTILNLIRGVTAPYPGAWTLLGNRKLTVWAAQPHVP